LKTSNLFHNSFKLQGKTFNNVDEILLFSKTISVEVHTFFNDWFNDKDFVEVKTSGSTGEPKIIELQKSQMINSAKATGEYFDLPQNTSALLCMSPNFIAGKMMLVRALILGWDLDVVEPVSNPLKGIKKCYDFCAMVPIQLHNSLNEINKVKKLIVGGGVVSKELLNNIQKVETNIFATYGMTETITHIAVKKLNNLSNSQLESETHYQTLPNVSISVDDRNCLVVNAPNVSNEVVITNDIVNLISSSQFDWLGRFDSVINSGGIKIIPEQIELKISEIISQRFFVVGIPDTILGEKLVLIVESKPDDKLQEKMKVLKTLSKYEFPKEIYFLEAFIETETQKINRIATLKLL